MNYKLKTFPQVQWWSESRDFSIEDQEGNVSHLRVTENPEGTSVKISDEQNEIWNDASSDVFYWVENELEVQEMQLDLEKREQQQLEKEKNQLQNQEN